MSDNRAFYELSWIPRSWFVRYRAKNHQRPLRNVGQRNLVSYREVIRWDRERRAVVFETYTDGELTMQIERPFTPCESFPAKEFMQPVVVLKTRLNAWRVVVIDSNGRSYWPMEGQA